MPPTQRPLRLEAAILSRMRSEVTSRSNWANDSRMFNVNLPMEVVVLNCWVTETKDTPCWSNSSTQLAAQLTTSPPPFDLSQDFAPDGLVADASEVIAISSKV